MREFLRGFLANLARAWNDLGRGQRTVLVGSAILALVGLVVLTAIPTARKAMGGDGDGYGVLFRDLDPAEASQIVEGLKTAKVEYRLENNGRDIWVLREKLAEQRLAFAAQGLPQSGSVGWEVFDKTQLGLTDFVQNINYRRALEGEIGRTIASLAQVENARVLISIPKPTLFTEKEVPPTASVVIKLRAGQDLDRKSVKGIVQMIASSVEGLKPQSVTVLDQEGRVLNRGGGDDPSSLVEGNAELRGQVEAYLQNKVSEILDGVVGPGNHRVQVSADIDFDQVEKTQEVFDPQSKVVRSEQTEEESKENSPADGTTNRETRTANYEINRSVVKTVSAPGSERKRVTVSVAVDGRWEELSDSARKAGGKDAPSRVWKPRNEDEVARLTELVRNAVGAQPGNDNVYVACVKFENPVVEAALGEMEKKPMDWSRWAFWGALGLLALAALLVARSLVRVLQEAIQPPAPAYAHLAGSLPEVPEEVDEYEAEAVRVNDLLSRLEAMTKAEPSGFSKLIRTWLSEGGERKGKK